MGRESIGGEGVSEYRDTICSKGVEDLAEGLQAYWRSCGVVFAEMENILCLASETGVEERAGEWETAWGSESSVRKREEAMRVWAKAVSDCVGCWEEVGKVEGGHAKGLAEWWSKDWSVSMAFFFFNCA